MVVLAAWTSIAKRAEMPSDANQSKSPALQWSEPVANRTILKQKRESTALRLSLGEASPCAPDKRPTASSGREFQLLKTIWNGSKVSRRSGPPEGESGKLGANGQRSSQRACRKECHIQSQSGNSSVLMTCRFQKVFSRIYCGAQDAEKWLLLESARLRCGMLRT